MESKIYMGSNLKMYKNGSETARYIARLGQLVQDIGPDKMELFILPSFPCLQKAKECAGNRIKIGAQTMFWEDCGRYTGEVSPLMLKDMGIDMVMAGHSERRHYFGESDWDENKRVLAAIRHHFTTLLCVGETVREKSAGISREVIGMQLKIGLQGVCPAETDLLYVAYEPVWAIGEDGEAASVAYINEMSAYIRNVLEGLFGLQGEKIPILYGGSVDELNAPEIMGIPWVDGLYVGRAAWDAERFDRLIRKCILL